MRRRLTHTPYFTALLLILTLTISFLHVPVAVSQNSEEIISELRELQGDVSALDSDEAFETDNIHAAEGQKKALVNKIEAVIHQIEAGAYEGAIRKLENDLINTIEAWITDDYEASLIEKVYEIIRLIKGELPPPDFSMEASPTSLTIALGESDSSTITVTSLNGFSELVDLTVSGVPSGVTTTLDPTQVTPPPDGSDSSILTVQVDLTAVLGSYILTVTGTSGTLEHSVDITLEITEFPPSPDFAISASPTSLNIQQGDSDFSTITITSLNGFSATVDLAVTSLPITGVTTTLDPTQVIPPADGSTTSTLTVQVEDSATPGMYTLTVTGTSDSLLHSVDIELEITTAPPSPDFSITVHPSSLSIQQGTSDTANIIITSLNGFSDLVTLTVSPAIDGVTYSLDPSAVTPPADGTITSTITIAVAETAIANTYVLALTGTSGDLQHSASLSLEITTAPPPPDVEPPTVRIDEPADGSYLAGVVDIVVFMYDENFKRAELTINDILIALWTPENVSTGEHSISWDTTLSEYPDDLYIVMLSAEDEAGNSDESSVTVIVDNTLPTIRIDEPVEGSYLAGIVDIKVLIQEDNLDKVELTINGTEVVSWTLSGEHIFSWDTITYAEGIYFIKLNALDKAGNIGEKTIKVIVDNTSPIIEAAAWTPKEPSTDEQVNITVKVIDPQPGSGIQNVTLWYRNTTLDDWQPIPMILNVTSLNWTATIPAQLMETTIEFYIEAFDNAGNEAVSDEIYEYEVIVPAGIPLAWIVAIILLILAATVAAIYFWRKRRRKKQGISSSRVKNYKLTILLCF